MTRRRALTSRVRSALLPLAERLPRDVGPTRVRNLSREARTRTALQVARKDPGQGLPLLEAELTPSSPTRVLRAMHTAATRTGRHDRATELIPLLMERGAATVPELLHLARLARERDDEDLRTRTQVALLALTPGTAAEVSQTLEQLAEILEPPGELDRDHLAALAGWHHRVAEAHPVDGLDRADRRALTASWAAVTATVQPLDGDAVAQLVTRPGGATDLVRPLTRARRFAELADLVPTWPEETLQLVSGAAWYWLQRHAAAHGWTELAALAATRMDGAEPSDETRQLVAEAADEVAQRESPWAPPTPRATTQGDPRSVLSVLGQSLPIRSGGYATRSHGILTSLAERGWRVSAVTRLGFPFDLWWSPEDDREPAPADVVDGITYHRLLTPGVRDYPRVPLLPYVTEGAAGITALAREQRASLVHASSLYDVGMAGLTAARELGVPFVYEMRGLKQLLEEARLPLFADSPRRQYLDSLEGTVAREADAVLVITEALRTEMVRMGVDPDRITVVPNGVDVSRFTPRERDEDLARRLGLTDRTVIGYVGGLVHYEGLDLLCQSLVRLRERRDDFHLLVVGDGAYQKRLHMVVDELGVGDLITFTGRVPHEEVEGYLSLIDITPFPRKPLRVCEMISPIKPFEAMAMRKAVVASDVAALAEIVQDGVTGRLFAKGDADDLARVLGELLDDPTERARLGAAARDWVAAERDWDRITDAVDRVYGQLLGESTSS